MIVFIHGVPETHTIWHKVAALVGEPSVSLALPGFGNERPAGFTATKDAYLDWIIERLAAIDEPIDLVGHDWGAAFTLCLATAGTVVLRTWAADVTYLLHPDYVWHDLAQTWQTPGAGEQFWADYLAATPADIAPVFESYGSHPTTRCSSLGWPTRRWASACSSCTGPPCRTLTKRGRQQSGELQRQDSR